MFLICFLGGLPGAAGAWLLAVVAALVDAGRAGRPPRLTADQKARVENVADADHWTSAGGYPGSGYLVIGAPQLSTPTATNTEYALLKPECVTASAQGNGGALV